MEKIEPNLTTAEVEALWKESRAVAWSRIQTAYGLEVATLAGAYTALSDYTYLSLGVLILGSALLLSLFLVMSRDIQHGRAFKAFLTKENKMFDFGDYRLGIPTFSLVPLVPLILIFANASFALVWWWCERMGY
jgi:uncharacterized protein YjfI (DUF2170 family)